MRTRATGTARNHGYRAATRAASTDNRGGMIRNANSNINSGNYRANANGIVSMNTTARTNRGSYAGAGQRNINRYDRYNSFSRDNALRNSGMGYRNANRAKNIMKATRPGALAKTPL